MHQDNSSKEGFGVAIARQLGIYKTDFLMQSNMQDNTSLSPPFPKLPPPVWFAMVHKGPFGLRDCLQKSGTTHTF